MIEQLKYIDPLSVPDPHALSYEQHEFNIMEWVQEQKEENPNVGEDDVFYDVCNAYIDSMLGKQTTMGKELRRRMIGF